ncbi:hydrogenase formation protein HypD [Hyalangium gracile]|uniref:hydrogenase formation protein HypD n=1 Tax=Hyalangium gracile TaxID=394092 RepID=UPI001CCA7D6D|nr:hydrogenase formation protein HypD [Hyalangium gracile]
MMKYVEEYRGAREAHRYAQALRSLVTRPWTLMEVCGGQTHAIVRFGIDQLLPPGLTLLHGPGCPVCVTPVALVDKALAIASRPGVLFCSFGDMLRVPGSEKDLLSAKAAGADVRIVYSPMDALALAERMPERQVVFFAVGFETTAPASAMAVHEARRRGLRNFSLLSAHVLVPPAMEAILASPGRRVDGFLAAGHVCTIMGTETYQPLVRAYRVPIVATGFEPVDLLQGIHMCVAQLEEGRADVENQYARAVRTAGNAPAQAMLHEVFEVVPRAWRGIGPIPASGLGLRDRYADWDAERKFRVAEVGGREDSECQSGQVLRGLLKPPECPAFGTRCTPETPLGATMVSSEGACAAYYRYRRSIGPCASTSP